MRMKRGKRGSDSFPRTQERETLDRYRERRKTPITDQLHVFVMLPSIL